MAELVLYLRPQEKKIFKNLPDELKDGWKVEEETISEEERPEELKMRRLMLQKNGGDIRSMIEESNTETDEGMFKLFETLKALPHITMMEVFFTLGSKALSAFLQGLLEDAKSDDDLKGIAELSFVRHALLESNAEFSPTH